MLRASLAFLALSGCVDPKAEHSARESDSTLVDPAGRYQMIDLGVTSWGEHQIAVLDTRTSRLTKCGAEPQGFSCSVPSAAFP